MLWASKRWIGILNDVYMTPVAWAHPENRGVEKTPHYKKA
jgi:hypothetical protein